ncbi:TPR-like protein [Laetiporus sulphureus 93-53]|uniref:ER membrane protein complex subunit 2 n=1 Tax=Laetiporus sulphureus 93-53 TaxID=1314785 RepID=A0A165F186_9APHY|nr:TPR-like protein [Laetiporus sulphureus 93-53]KZT08154.1 TPR-like protein [Laetiporus sulphureus 93-53]
MDFTHSLQKLASYRRQSTPKSKATLDEGLALLRSGRYAKQGDEGWDALEKLALAALDEGDIETADQCLVRLLDKYPGSSRVELLQGIRMEATEPLNVALKYYEELLEADEANPGIWRRKAVVLRNMGKIDKAVEELSAMLDTFYADVGGWLELADMYSSCQQYTYALQSLSHVLLLAPQNPFYFLQFAETAYLAGDLTLSLKMFLIAVDMTDDDDGPVPPQDSIPTSLTLRAWYGVKLCTQRLVTEPRLMTSSASQTPGPTTTMLQSIDELSTERLRTAYLNMKGESPPKADKDLITVMATMIQ